MEPGIKKAKGIVSQSVSRSIMFDSFETPWTIARQAPLSIGFPRQEYWSGLPFPSPGNLPDPGIKPRFPILQADSLLSELPGKLSRVSNAIKKIEHKKE